MIQVGGSCDVNLIFVFFLFRRTLAIDKQIFGSRIVILKVIQECISKDNNYKNNIISLRFT